MKECILKLRSFRYIKETFLKLRSCKYIQEAFTMCTENKVYFYIYMHVFLFLHLYKSYCPDADQEVLWLGNPAATSKVPGSNPGKDLDVKLSVLGPISGCAQKLVDGRCQLQSPVDLAVRSFPWFSPKLA